VSPTINLISKTHNYVRERSMHLWYSHNCKGRQAALPRALKKEPSFIEPKQKILLYASTTWFLIKPQKLLTMPMHSLVFPPKKFFRTSKFRRLQTNSIVKDILWKNSKVLQQLQREVNWLFAKVIKSLGLQRFCKYKIIVIVSSSRSFL